MASPGTIPTGVAQPHPAGPPYPPTTAPVGGLPTLSQDAALCIILGLLFLASSVANMAIFQLNKRHGRLFVFSAMMFAFCLIRGLALVLRLAWAANPTSGSLSVATNTFTSAGTPIAFVVNLFFAQRLVRAFHPHFGWSTPARVVHRLMVFLVVACLVMSIVAGVATVFTLDVAARSGTRVVLLLAGALLAVLAFVPLPISILAVALPRGSAKPESFGTGTWTAKVILVISTSALLTLGAIYRVGAAAAPRPIDNPAWYHGRAPYYLFNFVFDLVVSSLYLFFRFHQRFYVPSGCKGPGCYSREENETFDSFETLGGQTEKGNNESKNHQTEESQPHPKSPSPGFFGKLMRLVGKPSGAPTRTEPGHPPDGPVSDIESGGIELNCARTVRDKASNPSLRGSTTTPAARHAKRDSSVWGASTLTLGHHSRVDSGVTESSVKPMIRKSGSAGALRQDEQQQYRLSRSVSVPASASPAAPYPSHRDPDTGRAASSPSPPIGPPSIKGRAGIEDHDQGDTTQAHPSGLSLPQILREGPSVILAPPPRPAAIKPTRSTCLRNQLPRRKHSPARSLEDNELTASEAEAVSWSCSAVSAQIETPNQQDRGAR